MDCSTFAFDLHVLGTPPALILSQDQTLKLNLLSPPEGGGNSFNPISLFNLALGFIPPKPRSNRSRYGAKVGRSSMDGSVRPKAPPTR